MKSERMLRKGDYDIYIIELGKLPLFCTQNKIKQLIRIQLEKLHPCFTEQYSFDYVLKHEKGKAVAKAIVVDSLVVARQFSLSSASSLQAEEFGRQNLFLTEKAEKTRKAVWIAAILLLVAGITALTIKQTSDRNDVPVSAPVAAPKEEKPVYDLPVFLSETLPSLLAADMNISYFEYSSDKVTQAIIRESGVQREVIDAAVHEEHKDVPITYSSTTYQDKVPFITLSLSCDKQTMKTASFADVQRGITAIRNAVFTADGLPVSEQYEIRQFQCIVPYKSFKAFLSALETIQAEDKAKFQKFILDYNRDIGTINCIIVLDQFKCEEPLKMTQLADIFKAPVIKAVSKPQTTVPAEKKKVDTGRTLVGKMPAADGGTILYYRTTDGKIEYEKE